MMSARSIQRWPIALGLSGLLLFLGGILHPRSTPSLGFDQSTAVMLADPGWVPSHVLMLASFVLVLLGLIGLLRSGRVVDRSAAVTRIAIAGAALAVVEGVLHLVAVVDAAALRAGASTPILDAHLALAIVAYPALGLPLAALAWLGGRSRVLAHPLLGVVGGVGGVLHGIAGPIVVITRNQQFSFLFLGALPLAIWLVAVGISRLRTIAQPAPAQA